MASSQAPPCTPIVPNDFGFLLEQLDQCATQWERIATGLRFTKEEIDAIKVNPINLASAPASYLRDVIGKWLHWAKGDARGSKGVATLEALKRAVDIAGFGNVAKSLTLSEGNCDSKPLQVQSEPLQVQSEKHSTKAKGIQDQLLNDAINTLEKTFGDFVDRTYDAIVKDNVDNKKFRRKLLNISSKYKFQHKKFIKFIFSELTPNSTIDDAWDICSIYWTFLNYSLLEHLIIQFGDPDLISDFGNYKESLKTFRCQTRVRDFTEYLEGMNEHLSESNLKNLVVELGKDWNDCTLEDLEVSKNNIANYFFVPTYFFYIVGANAGSICVTWAIPATAAELIKKRMTSAHAVEFFTVQGIISLLIDDCLWQYPSGADSSTAANPSSAPRETADAVNEVRKMIKKTFFYTARLDSITATPLHTASMERTRELLMHAEYSVDCTDSIGWTPLHYACATGKLDMVRMLVAEFKADTNIQDVDGRTALMLAALAGHNKIVDAFLSEYQCPLGTKDECGNTVVHYATCGGHTRTLEVLLSVCWADEITTMANKFHDTPLDKAALSGHDEIVLSLIHKYDIDVNAQDALGKSLLHKACTRGSVNLVRTLVLDHKVDLNVRDNKSFTPIELAAKMGRKDIALCLLDEFQCQHNERLLHCACAGGNVSLVCLLVKEYKFSVKAKVHNLTPLHVAVLHGHIEIVSYLIDECDNSVHTKGISGRSCLHYACENGHLNLVQLLMTKYGGDLNDRDNNNLTPLDLAVMNGHTEIVLYLIDKCDSNILETGTSGRSCLHYACDLVRTIFTKYKNTMDYNKLTPLELAAKHRQKELVVCLLDEFKCKVDIQLLFYACMGGNASLVRYLAEKYEFALEASDTNFALLQVAVVCGHSEIMSYLIDECDISVHTKGNLGEPCLHNACKFGHLNLVKILVEQHKVDVYTRDNANNMAVHLAALHGREETVLYLIKKFNLHKAKGHQNRSLLHFACQSGNKNLVHTLISDFGADIEAKDDYNLTPYNVATLHNQQEVNSCLLNEFHCQPNNFNWYLYKVKALDKPIMITVALIQFLAAVLIMGLSVELLYLLDVVVLHWSDCFSNETKERNKRIKVITYTVLFLPALYVTGLTAETFHLLLVVIVCRLSFTIKNQYPPFMATTSTVVFLAAMHVRGLKAETFNFLHFALLHWLRWFSFKIYQPYIIIASTTLFLAAKFAIGSM